VTIYKAGQSFSELPGEPPRRERQCQQDEACQTPRGVRGGHEREGTDVPTRELRFDSFPCGDIASRENADTNARVRVLVKPDVAVERPAELGLSVRGLAWAVRAASGRRVLRAAFPPLWDRRYRSLQRTNCSSRSNGKWSVYLELTTCNNPAPGRPFSMGRAVRAACTTPCWQRPQAYFGCA